MSKTLQHHKIDIAGTTLDGLLPGATSRDMIYDASVNRWSDECEALLIIKLGPFFTGPDKVEDRMSFIGSLPEVITLETTLVVDGVKKDCFPRRLIPLCNGHSEKTRWGEIMFEHSRVYCFNVTNDTKSSLPETGNSIFIIPRFLHVQ